MPGQGTLQGRPGRPGWRARSARRGRTQIYEEPGPRGASHYGVKTRVWIAQGKLPEARGWVNERGLSVDDTLSYLREFEHITLARVLIAEYKSDRIERCILEAKGLLDRLLKAAQEGGRTGSVIEILVLQALAHQAQGDTTSALAALGQALILAQPEGYIRIFVDEGPSMAHLLSEITHRGIEPNYVQRLLNHSPSKRRTELSLHKTNISIGIG